MLRHMRSSSSGLMNRLYSLVLPWAAIALTSGPLMARVIRVDIASRSMVLNSKSWGKSGAYEKLIGRVYFAVDPKNPHNRQIVDIDNAPRNKQGEVEFSSDVYILR